MSTRRAIEGGDIPAAIGPYSPAISWGGLLFCAGQIALDPATGELVDGEVGEQTEACLDNLQAVCTAAGTSLAQALRTTIYVTDMSAFGAVNDSYATFFAGLGGALPARATVGVAALPRGAQVEIDAIVALGAA